MIILLVKKLISKMQFVTSLSCVYILILADAIFCRQKPGELTLTDVRQDQKLVSKPITSIPVSKGNPAACLAYCLTQSGKCKSINVNMGIGICEILGESKMEDDSLEMREETGWTYYGPKQEAPREVCNTLLFKRRLGLTSPYSIPVFTLG